MTGEAQQESGTESPRAALGRRLREARRNAGLSLAELGGEELTRGFLSAVENGRSGMSLEAISLVARRLGVTASHLIGEPAREDAPAELLLNDAEAAIRTQRPAEALQLIAEAAEIPEFRSRRLWLQGWALRELGRAREAIPRLQEALELAGAGRDLRHAILVRYTLAMALASATVYDEALIHLRQAQAQLLAGIDDQMLLGKITIAIGHILYMQGQFDAALAQYERARQIFAGVEDPATLAAIYGGMSRVCRQQGNLEDALRYSRLALAIFEQRHSEREAAHELSNLAARYEELEDLAQAIALGQEAVERAQRAKAPDIEALARSTLAAAYLGSGDAEQARREAEAARVLAPGDTGLGAIDAMVVLAKLAEERGDQATADEQFGAALGALKRNGFNTRYANVALTYSDALLARGDLQGALGYATAAARALAARPA